MRDAQDACPPKPCDELTYDAISTYVAMPARRHVRRHQNTKIYMILRTSTLQKAITSRRLRSLRTKVHSCCNLWWRVTMSRAPHHNTASRIYKFIFARVRVSCDFSRCGLCVCLSAQMAASSNQLTPVMETPTRRRARDGGGDTPTRAPPGSTAHSHYGPPG